MKVRKSRKREKETRKNERRGKKRPLLKIERRKGRGE